jgi:hypothetical protein
MADIESRLDDFGPLATLVTVTDAGTPHVGTVLVTAAAGSLRMQVGARTADNVQGHPDVTLAWIHPGRDYQLIIDGSGSCADSIGEDGLRTLVVRVEQGILHRLADRPTAGPTCIPLSRQTSS